jgi:hypothetical protein
VQRSLLGAGHGCDAASTTVGWPSTPPHLLSSTALFCKQIAANSMGDRRMVQERERLENSGREDDLPIGQGEDTAEELADGDREYEAEPDLNDEEISQAP